MPDFDGTGPEGKGPITGRGEGYCVLKLGPGKSLEGLAGVDNQPVRIERETSNPELIAELDQALCPRGGRKRGRQAKRR